jgi:hypothetical protein
MPSHGKTLKSFEIHKNPKASHTKNAISFSGQDFSDSVLTGRVTRSSVATPNTDISIPKSKAVAQPVALKSLRQERSKMNERIEQITRKPLASSGKKQTPITPMQRKYKPVPTSKQRNYDIHGLRPIGSVTAPVQK